MAAKRKYVPSAGKDVKSEMIVISRALRRADRAAKAATAKAVSRP
jgi:hypothetical protein